MPWGKMQIVCFENDKKTKDNQPDFRVYLSGDREQRRPEAGADDLGFKRSQEKKEFPSVDLDEETGIDVSQIPFS